MSKLEDKIKQLPQLDRIEFRQKYSALGSPLITPDFCFNVFMILGFLMILSAIFLSANHQSHIGSLLLAITIYTLVTIVVPLTIAFIVIDIAFIFIDDRKKKKLFAEYFKAVVIKKRDFK